MAKYTYVIIGGGMTGDAAVRGIRQFDSDGSIAVISAENHPPYNRPPLSKGLWDGMAEEKIWRHTSELGADLNLATTVTEVNPDEHSVVTAAGENISYQKLLLATGGTPACLPDAPDSVISFRNYDDYQQLREQADLANSILVIGGGFIGSEIAAALRKQEKSVTMVFPEKGIGGRIFPPELSRHLNKYYSTQGIQVVAETTVEKVTQDNGYFTVTTDSGDIFEPEIVVAGLGIHPNTQIAEEAGLEVDNGIIVDSYCRTSHEDIYAAGDVANFFTSSLNKRIRVEHEENANIQGMTAGINMAGGEQEYDYLPFFYSQLFENYYEGVGITDSTQKTVIDWSEPYTKGVIYYLDENRIRGVVLWNIQGKIDKAREFISHTDSVSIKDLEGLI